MFQELSNYGAPGRVGGLLRGNQSRLIRIYWGWEALLHVHHDLDEDLAVGGLKRNSHTFKLHIKT